MLTSKDCKAPRMSKQKFKNPMVNNQYKKPACHTDHCFQRHACCNNYRCCVCHCCLDNYPIYNKVHDRCVSNTTTIRKENGGDTTTATTVLLPTTKRARMTQATRDSIKLPATQMVKTTPRTWRKTTKMPLRWNVRTNATKKAPTFTADVTSTWDPWKPTVKGGKSRGYQNVIRDDKTSTIAGVAVALALVAIVAVVILVVMCSRRKKRSQSKAPKANTSNNDTAVVTIPLTMENVSENYRDTEEGTTSDTTVDWPITASQNGAANGKLHMQKNGVNAATKQAKRHRKSKHAKENGTAEQKRLHKEHAHRPNGATQHHMSPCEHHVAHAESSTGHCLNSHIYLGPSEAHRHNGLHIQHRNGSLECDV